MPPRPSITQLPEDVRAELDRRLLSNSFSGYVALAEWLAEQGYTISKSALHRYGQQFEARMAALKLATAQAKAIAEAVADDEGAMGEALTRLAQEKAFAVLLRMEETPGGISLPALGRMIADLNRAGISVKKYMAEVRAKSQATAEAVAAEVRQAGLSAETVELIRRRILGIGDETP
jgi:hypothetical protein